MLIAKRLDCFDSFGAGFASVYDLFISTLDARRMGLALTLLA